MIVSCVRWWTRGRFVPLVIALVVIALLSGESTPELNFGPMSYRKFPESGSSVQLRIYDVDWWDPRVESPDVGIVFGGGDADYT
jgi:hypothetical protein